jgi:CheY-like chemotaxis protein/DNA-binding XRE family transcriptional regulator
MIVAPFAEIIAARGSTMPSSLSHDNEPGRQVERLKQLVAAFRLRHNWSQVDFAERCDLSVASVRNLEQDRMDQLPKLDTLGKFARGLDMDIVSLVSHLTNLAVPAGRTSHKGRVLVVDDEPDLIHSYVLTLERLGYSATGVTSGALALSAFSYCPPDFVLLDVSMPGMNGLEVARTLRREFGFMGRIFLITATATTDDEAAAHGVDSVFRKNDQHFSIRNVALAL